MIGTDEIITEGISAECSSGDPLEYRNIEILVASLGDDTVTVQFDDVLLALDERAARSLADGLLDWANGELAPVASDNGQV